MKNIITQNNCADHHVRAYNFRVLTKDILEAAKEGRVLEPEPEPEPEPIELAPAPAPSEPPASAPEIAELAEAAPPPAPVVDEKLLNKLEELSESVVKLQMQLEKQEAEFSQRLLAECEQARANGEAAGKAAAAREHEDELAKLRASVSASCNKLNAAAAAFDEFRQKAAAQIKETALLIAREVINKELAASSAITAESYARTLLAQLDPAVQARLCVSPKDYEHVKAALGCERISVSADEAIAPGALIIYSDTLNAKIDLKERFAQASALLEQS